MVPIIPPDDANPLSAAGLTIMSNNPEEDDGPLPSERSMGYLRRRLKSAQKKLAEALGKVGHTEDFLRMVWSIDRIGDGHEVGFGWFNNRPESLVAWAKEPHHIHKWTLESLVNAYLRSKPLRKRHDRKWRTLQTRYLGTPLVLLQLINDLENAHDGLSLRRVSIFHDLGRLAQRQFPWQRGKRNRAAFFKTAYLYTFPEAAAYFQEKYGVSIHDFCFTGFGLMAVLQNKPATLVKPIVDGLPIAPDVFAKCLAMYARPESVLRAKAQTMSQVTAHAAYQSSVLRTWPCVLIEDKGIIVGPIPDLVIERFTNGLYYDLVDNAGALRDQIGRRFESLCKLLLTVFLTDVRVESEFSYGTAKRLMDSPDLFLVRNDETVVIIECKAKKAPISVKLGDEVDPLTDPAFGELAKAAFQVWRFVSHIRRGIAKPPGGASLAKGVSGLVLLMDTWLEMTGGRIQEVLARAREIAADKEPQLLPEDQIPIAFCNIDECENVIRSTSTDGFLRTVREASVPERGGWLLTSLQNEIRAEQQDKGDPLEALMPEVVKWWPAS